MSALLQVLTVLETESGPRGRLLIRAEQMSAQQFLCSHVSEAELEAETSLLTQEPMTLSNLSPAREPCGEASLGDMASQMSSVRVQRSC
jgi:hypothetical protein